MNLRLGSIVTIIAALGLAACDGVDESGIDEEGVLDEADTTQAEDLGQAEQASTDPCATGDDPNYTSSIALPGWTFAYQRVAGYINPGGSCGSSARRTTIVEVAPSSNNAHRHKFRVVPDFGAAGTTPATCQAMQLTTRLQKNVGGVPTDIGQWSTNGVWTGFACIVPQAWEHTRQNKSGSGTETNLYTVRTFAVRANGTYGSVTVTGNNLGL